MPIGSAMPGEMDYTGIFDTGAEEALASGYPPPRDQSTGKRSRNPLTTYLAASLTPQHDPASDEEAAYRERKQSGMAHIANAAQDAGIERKKIDAIRPTVDAIVERGAIIGSNVQSEPRHRREKLGKAVADEVYNRIVDG